MVYKTSFILVSHITPAKRKGQRTPRDAMRAYKFRIYPDAKRQSEIDLQLILSKNLYNKLLERAIEAYLKDKKSKLNMSSLNKILKEVISENQDYLKIYSQTRQNIFIRLQKSYQNFFRRCKEKKSGKKQNVGFPRFKSRDRYYSIVYPQDNGAFSIDKDMLRVSRIGRMKIEQHRQIEGIVKTMTIKREAGKYYAIFTAIKDITPPRIKDTNPVGIDMGLKTFAVLSDGMKIPKPNFKKDAQKGIAKWQRIVAKKKKGSKNRQKAKLHLQKEYQIATNQQNDYLHKITNELVNSGYTSFAMEKLAIQNMVKNHNLANAISGASWFKFKELLSYKAESAGLKVTEVNARNTSTTCSQCGNTQEMPLSKRTYNCNQCGMKKDRDTNAAINILNRAREGHPRRNASGDATSTYQRDMRVASMNQEHTQASQEWNP
jgi:putative transposase